MKLPMGLSRVLQAGAAAADSLGQRGDGLVLADDALVQHALHAQQLVGLGLREVGHGHARGMETTSAISSEVTCFVEALAVLLLLRLERASES